MQECFSCCPPFDSVGIDLSLISDCGRESKKKQKQNLILVSIKIVVVERVEYVSWIIYAIESNAIPCLERSKCNTFLLLVLVQFEPCQEFQTFLQRFELSEIYEHQMKYAITFIPVLLGSQSNASRFCSPLYSNICIN